MVRRNNLVREGFKHHFALGFCFSMEMVTPRSQKQSFFNLIQVLGMQKILHCELSQLILQTVLNLEQQCSPSFPDFPSSSVRLYITEYSLVLQKNVIILCLNYCSERTITIKQMELASSLLTIGGRCFILLHISCGFQGPKCIKLMIYHLRQYYISAIN